VAEPVLGAVEELMVDNLGIIEHAHLEPGPGLVVFTGETGTGKTLLMGGFTPRSPGRGAGGARGH